MFPKLRSLNFNLILVGVTAILVFIVLMASYNSGLANSNRGLASASKDCQAGKSKKIVFLKTHKCASSTLQNIFFRFGEKYQLNFVLPSGGHQLYGHKNRFSQSLLGQQGSHLQYAILCLHARWDYQEMEKVMGEGEKTTYITMLREPVDVFESQWEFYRLEQRYGMTIDEFALTDRDNKRIGKNQMLWDFGLDEIDNEELVREKIEDIESKFDLVMIMENFEESLIMMRNVLCWEHSDITSLKLNARKSEDSKLSESTRNLLQEVLKSDYALYNHFLKIFQQNLEIFGQKRMREELERLEEANKIVGEECKVAEAENKFLHGDARWWGPGLVGYKVNNEKEKCKLMAMAEISYTERLRKIQVERGNNKTLSLLNNF